MADTEEHAGAVEEDTPGYVPPAKASINEMLDKDKEDESLEKYKAALLGGGASDPSSVCAFPSDPRHVIVNKLALVSPGQQDVELDLSGDVSALKKKSFVVKEGAQYRMKIYFYVQREIVTGLKYAQSTYRKGIRVDKSTNMVGSYGPKIELQSFLGPEEEAPSGMLARGSYSVKSLVTDDDKNEHLKWEWGIDIKKDWQ